MRVLLIWPNSRNEVLGWGDLGAIGEPLALEYLGAALTRAGHEARILDLRLNPRDLALTLAEYAPEMVGVTAFSMHVRRAVEICREVKALSPTSRTVVGGHHATFLPEDFFDPAIDFVVCGEGTAAIAELADAGLQGEPVKVAGMWRHTGDRHILDAPAHDLSPDALARMPRPDRSLTAATRDQYFIDWMRPVALMRTTLGCPYRCTFCSIWKAMEGHYLIRDTAEVVEELEEIEEPWVFLIDDEAFINGKRMIRLADAIEKAGIHKRFFTYCRIDTLLRQREAVARWRSIGLERLFIGIDAITTKDLDEYNKNCSISQIESGLATARELGIEVFAQFVVNTDYDRTAFKQLTRFIEHHRITYPSFTVLTPLPGTDLLPDFAAVTERQPNDRPNWDLFDCQNAVTRTSLSKAEFRREYRGLYKVFKGSYVEYRDHTFLVDDRESPLLGGRVLVDNV
jgi:radical SAM superfamily enzyme YgiQ (UPF0313 family)